ncbi:dipeptide/oligopeptide/nickel ABC transporter permease/ATP-binding protein [Leifsonia naganoensis]|uniref:Peptide/nickel transport system permease protein n=1 Tax=Leifsonia naganoensis TaxID=150025 RepID=A0A853DMW7_9MICO|nr:dipeptide/oligopeptide/nickel ABC transporter permease/ATP-binding protein [Leifsonia naganoensis]NYK10512.1 peptide/nickel transport system permease protein [Leifsonia naganoensis]
MTASIETPLAETAAPPPHVRALLRQPLTTVALAVLLIIVVACALAPVIAPYGPLAQDLSHTLETPTVQHLLGTDELGRDVLSRLLYGGQPALLGSLVATIVFLAFGVTLGLIAGYSRGTADRIISSSVDVVMSLPSLVIVFAVLAVFDNSLTAAMVTLGLLSSGGFVRVVRAGTKATREELYVAAAQVSGIGTFRILTRHIVPRLVGPIVIQISLFAGIALVVQAGLGFLGLGIVPPNPSWGGMVGEAATVIQQSPWLLVPSGGIIALTVLALGLLGDAIRDANSSLTARAARPGTRRRRPAAAGSAGPLPVIPETRLVEVKGLTVSFGSTRVVHGIDLSIDEGEIVGLVGESGSGKTMIALSLLGLTPDNAQVHAERMSLLGLDARAAGPAEFRSIRGTGIGLVSQEPMVSLDPSFTVGFLLTAAIRAQTGLRGSALKRRAVELLRDVRLPEPEAVLRKYPHQLSGGMAQRVVIALSLAGDPRLLIADEPTTALDVTVQAEVLELLRQLRAERNMAILLVTHDLGVVADFCERVVVLERGTVVEERDVRSLFADPRNAYTRALIRATPSLIELDDDDRNEEQRVINE